MVDKWDAATKYEMSYLDLVLQRVTMMKYLLDYCGIEAMEEFFLNKNIEWSTNLKVGKLKKVFVSMVQKLAPKMIMRKMTEVIMEQAQYLIDINYAEVAEPTDNSIIVTVTKCSLLKQFSKIVKKLKFQNIEERLACTYCCIPTLNSLLNLGKCNATPEFFNKGCKLKVIIIPKQEDEMPQKDIETI